MARLTIYQDNDGNSTVVSNLFIDKYMKDANDAQLKVYLYLLRMMNARLATSVSDIADKFNHTEKEVERALTYWEKRGLLSLDYAPDKTLIGIHIRELREDAKPQGGAPVSSFVPVPAEARDPEKLREETAVPAPRFEKPVYTAAQLREFKERENTEQLLYVTERYIGRPLTPAEMKTILYFTDELHFSDDLVDYLIQYCVDKGKKDFKYIEKVAVNWAEEGITTPAQAQAETVLYNKNVYSIMKELGKSNAPTPKETEYITRWINEYGFANDVIFEACERTVMATDKNRFEYADRILSSWHEQNVHHKADIARIDELYRQRKKNTAPQPNRQYTNRFNQFSQNTYDFDALEKELLSN
ncbi:MAG: DnaD domain protein [Roseburia sp.]|nr:DnaD domain protein [Roseburia sp.]MCM1099145.1 DnaD domain protein [Ruminococcus flavefaciens]